MQLDITTSQMQAAITVWDSVRNTEKGYQYLTSGNNFEINAQYYKIIFDTSAMLYCHLGVWESSLIFILSTEEDSKGITKDNTIAVTFYSDLAYYEPTFDPINPKFKNTIPKEVAQSRSFSWLISSKEWFTNQLDKNEIVKYFEINPIDFSEEFLLSETCFCFFGIKDNEKYGKIIEIIIAAKYDTNTDVEPNMVLFADITKPVPPYGLGIPPFD